MQQMNKIILEQINKTSQSVKRRVEILQSKIRPDLDTVQNRIMQAGQGGYLSIALDYEYGTVNMTTKFKRKEITENGKNEQNPLENYFPLR